MTIAQLIDAYVRDRERHHCRPSTLRHYRGRLRPLADAFGERQATDLTREDYLDFLAAERAWSDGREKAPDTYRATVRVLSQFLKFAVDEEHLPTLPLKPKDLAKPQGRQRTRLPTPEEVAAILEHADPRWRLIYQALRFTGARPSELCDANIEHIESAAGGRMIVLTKHKTSGKTGAVRKIPLGRSVAPLVQQAIGRRRCGPVFTAADGRRWTVARLSSEFRRLRRTCGLEEQIVLYCTRHEFGTAVAKKVGILQAKELLGHASITTTQRYAHLTDADLSAAQQLAFAGE